MRAMSRRDQIKMSEDEVQAFLAQERVMVVASNGRDGWPHLMPMWYVLRDGDLWAWTYARSQKARNFERDDRVTLQVEAGDSDYGQLRGVMIKARVVLLADVEAVTELGMQIFDRYTGGAGEEVRAMVRKQAEKRVGLQFVHQEIATWDHRKLAVGVY